MKINDDASWTRREFTAASALAILSGVTITISGCSDGGSSTSPTTSSTTTSTPNPPPSGGASDVTGVISANHGHIATVTAAQLSAGNAVTLDIGGTANHPHTVSLSADELGRIANGDRVQTTSSNNVAHVHTVTFN